MIHIMVHVMDRFSTVTKATEEVSEIRPVMLVAHASAIEP